MVGLDVRVRKEIERLHEVFEAWLAGSEGASLTEAEAALAEGFRLVSPGGELLDRERVLSGLQSARGGLGEGFRIEVRAVTARELGDGGLVLATYEEWQDKPGSERRGRLSSALLRVRADGGFDWLHVHETWLPEAAGEGC